MLLDVVFVLLVDGLVMRNDFVFISDVGMDFVLSLVVSMND